jgi:hypothetical protein
MTRTSEQKHSPFWQRDRVITSLAYRGFLLSLLISVALVFGLATLESQARWLGWVRLMLGCLVGAEGCGLATNWHNARDLTLLRIGSKRRRRRGARTRTGSLLGSLGLQLLGVLWIGAGVFLIAKGVAILL